MKLPKEVRSYHFRIFGTANSFARGRSSSGRRPEESDQAYTTPQVANEDLKAVEHLKTAAGKIRTELAKVYQAQKRYHEAENVLNELIGLEPQSLQARTELAKVYQAQKRYGEAEERLKEYLKLDPRGLQPRTELAKVYQAQKRYDEAIEIYQNLIQRHPYHKSWRHLYILRLPVKQPVPGRFLRFFGKTVGQVPTPAGRTRHGSCRADRRKTHGRHPEKPGLHTAHELP